MTPIDVDDTTFAAEVLQSDRPVLVDLHATWCGPCRALAPLVDQVAADGAVKVVKIDVDAAPDTARNLQVMSVPTLLLYVDGQPVARHSGAMSKAQLDQFVAKAVS